MNCFEWVRITRWRFHCFLIIMFLFSHVYPSWLHCDVGRRWSPWTGHSWAIIMNDRIYEISATPHPPLSHQNGVSDLARMLICMHHASLSVESEKSSTQAKGWDQPCAINFSIASQVIVLSQIIVSLETPGKRRTILSSSSSRHEKMKNHCTHVSLTLRLTQSKRSLYTDRSWIVLVSSMKRGIDRQVSYDLSLDFMWWIVTNMIVKTWNTSRILLKEKSCWYF